MKESEGKRWNKITGELAVAFNGGGILGKIMSFELVGFRRVAVVTVYREKKFVTNKFETYGQLVSGLLFGDYKYDEKVKVTIDEVENVRGRVEKNLYSKQLVIGVWDEW